MRAGKTARLREKYRVAVSSAPQIPVQDGNLTQDYRSLKPPHSHPPTRPMQSTAVLGPLVSRS